MKFFATGIPDQYYAVTARLAADGHQRTTMRVVAGAIIVLGLPAMLAAGNTRASDIPGGRALLAVIPLACLGLASPWLRYRWPTRGQSVAVVILGTLLLAAGCIVPINPFSGLLIATSFSFVLGYTALFHSTGLQMFVATAAAGTVGWLMVRIAMTDVPTALAVTTPVILINVAVLVACRIIADIGAAIDGRTDVEPLTGLLTRQTFDELAATMLGARNRGEDRFLVIIVTSLDSFAAWASVQGRRDGDGARVAAAQALRDTVRRDALIGHVDEAEFLIADTFTSPDPTPLAERVRGAMAAIPGGVAASLGVVSTPLGPLSDRPPYDILEEVIALATTAMFRARRRGGNQIEYVLNPDLSGPVEPDSEPDHL
jgi:diguanylate cyclase (GGDEF)-like protein